MKNIVLIGMPGSGKSTFGKRLAACLGRTFIDCDDFIEEREQKTIPELFARGEDHFRQAETRAVMALAQRDGLVIASGGGVIKREDNIRVLRKNGVILFIDRAAEDIAGDVDVSRRPLLAEGPEKLYLLYKERIAAYRAAADRIIQNRGTEDAVLEALVHLVRNEFTP